MLKPAVTGAIEHAVKDYVENGEVEKRKKDGDKKKPGSKEQVGEQAADNLLNKTHAKEYDATVTYKISGWDGNENVGIVA